MPGRARGLVSAKSSAYNGTGRADIRRSTHPARSVVAHVGLERTTAEDATHREATGHGLRPPTKTHGPAGRARRARRVPAEAAREVSLGVDAYRSTRHSVRGSLQLALAESIANRAGHFGRNRRKRRPVLWTLGLGRPSGIAPERGRKTMHGGNASWATERSAPASRTC